LGVEFLSKNIMEELEIHHTVRLRHPYLPAKAPQCFGRTTPTPEPADGGHPGIIPGIYDRAVYQGLEKAFAHDRVSEIQPGKFVLPGPGRNGDIFEEPVVKRTMIFKLQSAYGMCHSFDGIFISVSEIVHRVDAPFLPRSVMSLLENSIKYGIPHVDIGMSHVDLCPEHALPFLELPSTHFFEKFLVLPGRPISVGRRNSRFRKSSPAAAYFFRILVIHIGQSFTDKLQSPRIKGIEVIRSVAKRGPGKTQPADILFYGLHIFRFFLGRVRIIETKITGASKSFRKTKVETYGLCMPYMEISVGLRGKAGDYRFHTLCIQIIRNNLLQKIQRFRGLATHSS
jgi:hypothetical protein